MQDDRIVKIYKWQPMESKVLGRPKSGDEIDKEDTTIRFHNLSSRPIKMEENL